MRFLVLLLVLGAVGAGGVLILQGSPAADPGLLSREDAESGPSEAVEPEDAATTSPPEGGEGEPAPRRDVAPGPGSISGMVQAADSDVVVDHARVTVRLYTPKGKRNYALVSHFEKTVEVEDDGTFEVQVPGGGWYRATASAEGFAPASIEELEPGDPAMFELDVGARLSGLVVEQSTETPVAGVQITATSKGADINREVRTSPEGTFELVDLPAGTLHLSLRHPDFVSRGEVAHSIETAGTHSTVIALDPGKVIRGTVHSKDDGFPIKGARVALDDHKRVTTDGQGRFVLRGLPEEALRIQVTATGYLPQRLRVNLSGSRKEARLEVELAEGAEVYGRVTDTTGEPVVAARVKLFRVYGSSWMHEDWSTRHIEAFTDELGRYSMNGLHARKNAEYAVGARRGEEPFTLVKDVRIQDPEDRVRADIVVRPGGSVAGRVTDQEGAPVGGARVVLRRINAWESGKDSRKSWVVCGTGEDGRYAFRGVAEGKYRIRVEARGYSTGYKNNVEVVGSSDRYGVDIKLEKGHPLEGLVEEKGGGPLEGVEVRVYAKRGRGTAVSDEDGRFVIPAVPKGPYRVRAELEGYARFYERKMETVGGRLHIELSEQPVLRGRVVGAETGEPVEEFRAMLVAKDPDRGNRERRYAYDRVRDGSGRFSLQAEPGTYKLRVTGEGFVDFEKEGVTLGLGEEPEEVVVRMQRGGAIEGFVRDPAGRPLRGVSVYHRRLGSDSENYKRETSTEQDGYFYIGDLDAGDHAVVLVEKPYALVHRTGIYVGGARPAREDFRMESFCGLEVRVAWEDLSRGGPGRSSPRINASSSILMEGRGMRLSGFSSRSRRKRARVTLEHLGGRPFDLDYKGWSVGGSRYRLEAEETTSMKNGRPRSFPYLHPGLYRIKVKAPGYPEEQVQYRRLDYGTRAFAEFRFEPEEEKKEGETPAGTGNR